MKNELRKVFTPWGDISKLRDAHGDFFEGLKVWLILPRLLGVALGVNLKAVATE